MIGIVNYNCGNTGSIHSMLRYLGADSVISSDPEELQSCSGIILPGVGSFDVGVRRIKEFGLSQFLDKLVTQEKKPVMGICLGAQLMTNGSEEGSEKGFGWVDVDTVKFSFENPRDVLPIPHMGWSHVEASTSDELCEGFDEATKFYFVHSYHFTPREENVSLIDSWYGYNFLAAFRKDNVIGVQFHPEKSHRHGMQIMRNFLKLCGECYQD